MQKNLLKVFLGIGVVLLPFAFNREKLKEWLLVFFLKGYISSFISTIVVKNKNISFPVRFMSKFFKISIVFDYFLFPLLCVFFNRTTVNSKPINIVIQSLVYSMPMTIMEIILERYTDLVHYKKNWNWIITYTTLAITFLFVRVVMSIVRKLNLDQSEIK